jgi:phosphate transport system protein
VAAMFELDKRALNDGLQALLDNNRQLAYGVILRDQRIDDLEKEVDRLCLEFLVRQQPVALHLRFAYVTIKINQELERIGDYAESIARQVLKLSLAEKRPATGPFEEIAHMSIAMLEDAVQSFLNQDTDLARRTMATEEKVDQLRNQIKADLKKRQRDGELPLETLNPFLTIARRFERTSDQAQNICEEVLYMCTGEYAKHIGTEVYRILIVDDHNSCRSQMAEGIATSMALPNLIFSSAGLDPKPLDADTVKFMASKGVDIAAHTSKSVDQVPNLDHYHVIIALSEKARKVFPPPPTKTVALDWQTMDPSALEGSPAEKQAAFEDTYEYIHTHIQDLGEAILGDKID